MTKYIWKIVIILMMALTLTACGPNATPEVRVVKETLTQEATELPTETPLPTDTPEPISPTSTPTPESPSLGDTWTRPVDDMVMVYVPAGTFPMGSDEDDVDYAMQLCDEYWDDCERSFYENEQPVHDVTLNAFWIDRTEVTNAQYADFLNKQGNQKEGGVTWLDLGDENCLIEQEAGEFQPKSGYADHPVIVVSWYGANAYCEWVGAQLPTEAEWEYAARGPEGRIFPWGDTFDGRRLNFCDTNCNCLLNWKATEYDDGYERTAPVGSFPDGASWCDALDMAGNVWEWVEDWYDENYYEQSPSENPTGPQTGEYRVLRGGSWDYNPLLVRCAYRNGHNPVGTWINDGFRCARGSQ